MAQVGGGKHGPQDYAALPGGAIMRSIYRWLRPIRIGFQTGFLAQTSVLLSWKVSTTSCIMRDSEMTLMTEHQYVKFPTLSRSFINLRQPRGAKYVRSAERTMLLQNGRAFHKWPDILSWSRGGFGAQLLHSTFRPFNALGYTRAISIHDCSSLEPRSLDGANAPGPIARLIHKGLL